MGVIYLVRHGQASFGAADYDALSELGHRQAQLLGAALAARSFRFDYAICGGMRRHRETAYDCLSSLGVEAKWDEDTGFNEYDHREVLAGLLQRAPDASEPVNLSGEGDPRRAFQAVFERALERWMSGSHDSDYTESWPAFCARVEGALERLVARVGRSEVAIVFTSGGAIGALAKMLLELSDEVTARVSATLANGSVTKLIQGRAGLHLSTLNEHAYLEHPTEKLISYR